MNLIAILVALVGSIALKYVNSTASITSSFFMFRNGVAASMKRGSKLVFSS